MMIETRCEHAKIFFTHQVFFLCRLLNLKLCKKKVVQCYIYSILSYGIEAITLSNKQWNNRWKIIEIWLYTEECYRSIERLKCRMQKCSAMDSRRLVQGRSNWKGDTLLSIRQEEINTKYSSSLQILILQEGNFWKCRKRTEMDGQYQTVNHG